MTRPGEESRKLDSLNEENGGGDTIDENLANVVFSGIEGNEGNEEKDEIEENVATQPTKVKIRIHKEDIVYLQRELLITFNILTNLSIFQDMF